MFKRKLTRIEKIILIGSVNMLVILTGFWLQDKKPNRDFFIPKNYDGWVIIKYSVEGAPPLEYKDGVQQIHISGSGYAETSSLLEVGWRKDQFFWKSADKVEQIPSSEKIDGEYHINIHSHKYFALAHRDLLLQLKVGTDTTLWDGTEIVKTSANEVDFQAGQKTLEHFYVSQKAESIMFNPPPNPRSEALESTENREIPIQ